MNSRRKNRVSIIDVANRANVSIATVSRVLNKAPNILPATQRKVMQTVLALNYTPNAQAQNLRGSCRDVFGFLLSPEIVKINDSPLIFTIQHLLAETIFESGYHLISEKLEIDHNTGELVIPKMLRQQRCCGCFLLGYMPQQSLNTLVTEGIPICLLGSYDEVPSNCFSIDFDFEGGMNQIIQYLSALGHSRIGFIYGSLSYPVNQKKMNGLKQALKEFGLKCEPELLYQLNDNDQNFSGGRRATSALLALEEPPSAICYVNDWIALGGMFEVESRGLKIPQDLSLIGFDNSFIAQQSSPGLTCVSTDFNIMSHVAADTLIKKVRKMKITKSDNTKLLIPTELVRRESCQIFR